MLCSRCFKPIEYAFSRKRNKKYTTEDGPAAITITVTVGHCLEDGHYSTILSDDIVMNKQYCISEIRSVLENKADFSLASSRTRAYWRSWFRGIWNTIIKNIQLSITKILSKNDISIALYAFLKECGDDWLRFVLDIFSTEFNNLCMFFDIICHSINSASENLRKLHVYEGADAPIKGQKPLRGG